MSLFKIAYTISPNIDRWINVWLQSDILVRLRRGCNLCVILASVKVGLFGVSQERECKLRFIEKVNG